MNMLWESSGNYLHNFQASLAKLEEACRQEMEKHKQLLDKEYEQLLTQFSKELEKLQLKHQEELGKRLKMNINTEKKLIKEVSQVSWCVQNRHTLQSATGPRYGEENL